MIKCLLVKVALITCIVHLILGVLFCNYYTTLQKQVAELDSLGVATGLAGPKQVNCCPDDCDVCRKMPLHKDGEMKVHHWLANTGLWNEDYRWNNLSKFLSPSSLVIYVGGNTDGSDGRVLLDKFNSSIVIFEPVPAFFKRLNKTWQGFKESRGFKAELLNIGLGGNSRSIKLRQEDLAGQSTFGMKERGGDITLQIQEASKVIRDILSRYGRAEVDLLHVNCEGCEWEMLENLVDTQGLMAQVKMLQFGTHYFPKDVPDIAARYCNIRERLSETHGMVYGVPWAWERWDRT